mgnify:CR=1 FL=1
MNVIVTNEQTDLSISKKQVVKIVKAVLCLEEVTCDEVSINFVTTEEICALHRDYFDDPSPTDCISFPMSDGELTQGIPILGDVFVCPETAIEYSKENQVDLYEEVTLYIVHGLLHLIGYDDITELEQLSMREAEKRHMKHLKEMSLCLS